MDIVEDTVEAPELEPDTGPEPPDPECLEPCDPDTWGLMDRLVELRDMELLISAMSPDDSVLVVREGEGEPRSSCSM